jgi:hypothetical protein
VSGAFPYLAGFAFRVRSGGIRTGCAIPTILLGDEVALAAGAPTTGVSGDPAESDARGGFEFLAGPKARAATKSPEPSARRILP